MKKNEVTLSQSKTIANARYTMSKDETRILLLCAASDPAVVRENDEGFKLFRVATYAELYGLSKMEAKRDVREAIEKMWEREVEVKNADGVYRSYRLIDAKHHDEKRGVRGIRFSREMYPIINDLRQFNYQLSDVARITNTDHVRFYNWLYNAWSEGKSELYMELETIRERLKLDQKKSYSIYNNLKQGVIEPALTAINKFTPLAVSFEPVKKGRKNVGVTFYVGKAEEKP